MEKNLCSFHKEEQLLLLLFYMATFVHSPPPWFLMG